jgi:hypothetical protein
LKISVLKFNYWIESDFKEGVVNLEIIGNPIVQSNKGNDVESGELTVDS